MKYGIASYHRPECKTVATLLKEGVKPSEIIISTQTLEDYEQYRQRWSSMGVEVIYREVSNAAGNRNTILLYCPERPIVLFDDDITSFAIGNKKENFRKRESGEALERIQQIATLDYDLIGCSESTSNLNMQKRPMVSTNVLLQGSFLIIKNSWIRFNESYKCLDDYELTLRALRNGLRVARYNYFATNKPKNGTNKGGCYEQYANGEHRKVLWLLQNEYSNFKVNKDYTGGRIVWNQKSK